jgi:hypothetical protein
MQEYRNKKRRGLYHGLEYLLLVLTILDLPCNKILLMATWEDNICCFQLGMRSKTSDAAVVHDLRSLWYCCWKLLVRLEGTYGAAAGKVAVLSNGRGAVDVVVLVRWPKQ